MGGAFRLPKESIPNTGAVFGADIPTSCGGLSRRRSRRSAWQGPQTPV